MKRHVEKEIADGQWRLKPTPTCGAMLDSKNVSSMASYRAGQRRVFRRKIFRPVTALHLQLVPYAEFAV